VGMAVTEENEKQEFSAGGKVGEEVFYV